MRLTSAPLDERRRLERLRGGEEECVWTRLGFVPDAKQREILTCGARWMMVNCSRQWGKSTTVAALCAMRAMENPGRTILCVGPTLRQAELFVEKARGFLLRAGVLAGRQSQEELRLTNGARVVGVPAMKGNLRGYSNPRMIVIDEAAQVKDEVYAELRPMLATGGGEMVLISTPFGERGFFWKEWTQGGDVWHRIQVRATECARISPEFLELEWKTQGEDYVRQEYLCEFLAAGGQIYRREWLDAVELRGLDVKRLEHHFAWEVE